MRMKMAGLAALVLALGAIAGAGFIGSPEYKARRVVERHLRSIQDGKGNPYRTVDVSTIQVTFNRVESYRYLGLDKKLKVKHPPTTYDRRFYEDHIRREGKFKSYEEFLKTMESLYGKKAMRIKGSSEDRVVVRNGANHYEYDFVYSVTASNGVGPFRQGIYAFKVRPSFDGDFEITDIRRR